MATFAKQVLSGSTDGKGIKVDATATPGTTIHTGPSSASEIDEVWVYAMNTSASPVKLTLEWGGTSSPDDLIELTLDAEPGLVLVAPGLPIQGNASPLVVRAFAATGDVVVIHGYVNAIV